MWLSLVERCVRDAEAAGSNPVISTIKTVNPFGFAVFIFVYGRIRTSRRQRALRKRLIIVFSEVGAQAGTEMQSIWVDKRDTAVSRRREPQEETNRRFESAKIKQKKKALTVNKHFLKLVEMTGFEPAASASRTQRSTKLSHISILRQTNYLIIRMKGNFVKSFPIKKLKFFFCAFFDIQKLQLILTFKQNKILLKLISGR